MTEERTISRNMVFQGRAVKLRVDTVVTPGGHEKTREIIEHDDCVAVVPIDDDGKVLMVRQFRKAVENTGGGH